jgi:branched-chain amino acid transport system permease protein
MSRTPLLRNVLLACLIIALALLPLYVGNKYVPYVLTAVFINIMLAVSLRLSLITGQFNCGHVAFVGIGAYGAAILAQRLGIPTDVTLLLGGVIAALISIPIGVTTLRLRGVYFALVTIAFVQVVVGTLTQARQLTGGATGLGSIPTLVIFGISIKSPSQFYWVAFVLMLVTILLLYRLEIGRLGVIWKAIRQSDPLSTSLGINTMLYKTVAFTIGCFFAGVAGALFAYFQNFLLPGSFGFLPAVRLLIFCFVGGTGSIVGPIVGAAFLTLVAEPLRGFSYYEALFFSIILMVTIILLPGGLVTLPSKLGLRRTEKPCNPVVEASKSESQEAKPLNSENQ